MSVKERILVIRIMKKLQACPEYARALGVEVRGEMSLDSSDLKESMRIQNETVI